VAQVNREAPSFVIVDPSLGREALRPFTLLARGLLLNVISACMPLCPLMNRYIFVIFTSQEKLLIKFIIVVVVKNQHKEGVCGDPVKVKDAFNGCVTSRWTQT
jgi:hypothetical protein